MFSRKMRTMLKLHFSATKLALFAAIIAYMLFFVQASFLLLITAGTGFSGIGMSAASSLYITIPVYAFLMAGNRTRNYKCFVSMGLTRKDFYKSSMIYTLLFTLAFMIASGVLIALESALYYSLNAQYFSILDILYRNYGMYIIFHIIEWAFFVFLGIMALKLVFLTATYVFDKHAWILAVALYFGGPMVVYVFVLFLIIFGPATEPLFILFGHIVDFIIPNPYTNVLEHVIFLSFLSMLVFGAVMFYRKMIKITRL